MEVLDEKYVVIKRNEKWEQMMQWLGENGATDGILDFVDDAVVIRRRDPFAVGALYSYLHTMRTFMELMEQQGMEVPPELVEIADYFAMQANLAQEQVHRLPG